MSIAPIDSNPMRILTQAPTVFRVRFYPQLDCIGLLAIAISLYLFHWMIQRWHDMLIAVTLLPINTVITVVLAGLVGLLAITLGIAQVISRLQLITLTLDQGAGLLVVTFGFGISSHTCQYPLTEVTGIHLINRFGIAPRLLLWIRQGDRVQGKSISIPVHFNIKELENIKKTVEFILISIGQQWLTTNLGKGLYQVGWDIIQTPDFLIIQTNDFNYKAHFVADKNLGTLKVHLYRSVPYEYRLSDIQLIQLEDDYLPSGKPIPWIRLKLKNGDRPLISQDWDKMGGYREIAKHLARFLKVELQIL